MVEDRPSAQGVSGFQLKMFGPGVRDNSTYIVTNVSNVGTQQTTITHVVMLAYQIDGDAFASGRRAGRYPRRV